MIDLNKLPNREAMVKHKTKYTELKNSCALEFIDINYYDVATSLF